MKRRSSKRQRPEPEPLAPQKKWAPADVEYLRDNFATMSLADIAKHLGRTHRSVAKRYHELKLKMPRPEGTMHFDGLWKMLDIPQKTLMAILKFAGIDMKPVRVEAGTTRPGRYVISIEQAKAAVELYKTTESPEEAARRLGTSPALVISWLKLEGIRHPKYARYAQSYFDTLNAKYRKTGMAVWLLARDASMPREFVESFFRDLDLVVDDPKADRAKTLRPSVSRAWALEQLRIAQLQVSDAANAH